MEIKKVKTPMGLLKLTKEDEEYQVLLKTRAVISSAEYDLAEEEFAKSLLLSMNFKNLYSINSSLPATKEKSLNIRDKIKKMMILKGVRASELSELTGMDKSTISKFLSGEKNINMASLEVILMFLGLQLK